VKGKKLGEMAKQAAHEIKPAHANALDRSEFQRRILKIQISFKKNERLLRNINSAN
jgi:hypothetical protein